MRVRSLLLVAVLAAFGVGVATAQQRAPADDALTSDCLDDDHNDRCDPETQRAVRERYNLNSIQDLAAMNVRTRRVFFVDGYGNEMPVVAFERRPGQDPSVIVSELVAHENEQIRVVEMREAIDETVWDDVIRRTQLFHRTLAPPPAPLRASNGDDEEAILICLHSWVMTMEASDPGERQPVRSRTQDACNDGLVEEPSFALARIAYEALPYCRALDLARHRNEVTLLQNCALLQGDRIAAARALNRSMAMDDADDLPERVDAYFHASARVDWMGEVAQGAADSAALWQRHDGDRNFFIYRIVGETADRVRVIGVVYEDYGEDARRARAEQTWTRQGGWEFRLLNLKVDPFETATNSE